MFDGLALGFYLLVEQAIRAQAASPTDPLSTEMAQLEIDGESWLGVLSIPALGLELPVLAQWDFAALQNAPCRYFGATKSDDLVIAAHNYRRHFGALGTLQPGEAVCFLDMEGAAIWYEVAAVDVLPATAVEEMTAGEYDLTLFTCDYSGRNRITLRCMRAAGQ